MQWNAFFGPDFLTCCVAPGVHILETYTSSNTCSVVSLLVSARSVREANITINTAPAF
jgi:hypothetical protein